jgi:small basic protein
MVWIGIHVATHYGEVAGAGKTFDSVVSEALARAFQQSPHAFIVGGITMLLSMQLFGLGVLALQLKQYFEEMFHLGTRVYANTRELERLQTEREPTKPA